ncbi:hypothetical protein VFPBJ_06795 [Purpureocillium lilacinum]|uniref:Uncharacterized protein n=1 Tax=Purpureocillium lilacinum TaxID=33203 RepID=A0A179GLB1_PURLI|nr:hypothetical protein VFPBJ_06795 [Purpureocillium lilacinum]
MRLVLCCARCLTCVHVPSHTPTNALVLPRVVGDVMVNGDGAGGARAANVPSTNAAWRCEESR